MLAADKSPLAKLDLAGGDCIVFLGDSITHQRLYTQYVEDFLYTRYPNRRLRLHNAGVGGARAIDALDRFDRDVASYKPKYVTVLLGMNDGRYRPYDEEIFQTYRDDMLAVIERIRGCGATPILMTPTMFDAGAARTSARKRDATSVELYNSVLAYYGTWLRDVANENGFGFVDMYSPLNNLTIAQRKKEPGFTLIKDAVHPGPSGQLIMAAAMLQDLGFAGPLSNIRLDLTRDNPVLRTKGGRLTNFAQSDGKVEFNWLADGLPFVVLPEAQVGAEMLRMGARMSRERISVFGLSAHRYELLIDDRSVGKYSARDLAGGIELQGNELTPQYGQAKKVAMLNRDRNAGPIKKLRDEWSRFQRYARDQRKLAANPDDKALSDSVAELEPQMNSLESRVATHQAAAKALEDEIFQVNSPRVLKFSLRPLENRELASLPHPSGDKQIIGDGKLELIFQRSNGVEGGLTEGPAVARDGKIFFSDISRGSDPGRIMRFDPQQQTTTVFAEDSGKSNGLVFDSQGLLWACEGADQGGRRISRWNIETKQRVTVADRFEGKRFNSPNDLCGDHDGRVYFTDPRYLGDETRELATRAVYRIDVDGRVSEVSREVVKPNGIAISPDGSTLYVADHDNGTDRIDPAAPAPPQGDMKIYAFSIDRGDGSLHERRILFDFGSRKGCDGMTVDSKGNVYLTARDPARPGVLVLSPAGREIAFIPTGAASQFSDPPMGLPSNVEFGIGPDSNLLYITIDTGLYRIRLAAHGFHRQYSEAGR